MDDRHPGVSPTEEAPAGSRVEAKVKWFNAAKGFGFVSMADGAADAFLPMATLRRAGYDEAREGASIVCEVGMGTRGPLVLTVLAIDNSTATAGGSRRPPLAVTSLEGVVKWFEPDRGYGFIAPDGGGKDVFIHVTALRRSGVAALEPGLRVRVEVVDGKKGQEADRIVVL
jgi:cold shock protein